MKIAYLISNYLPKVGGAEIFVHNLARGIIANGHESVVITPSRGGTNDKIFKYEIVRLNPLLNRLLFINFSLGKKYLEKILCRLQKKYKFDIWQVTIGYPLGTASVDFFNRNRIPCVLRCAGEDIQMLPELGYGYRLNRKIDKRARENYKKFTALITAGDGTKKEYLSLGAPEDKRFIIPNGVYCKKFEANVDRDKIRNELGIGDGQKLIITVGRNHPKKGFKDIPQIIKRLLEKGLKFKWLLVGKDCGKIKILADKEGVGEYLIVRETKSGFSDEKGPEIPKDELIQYYKASDIFAFPTLIELFANVLIEAMAAGLPVVTTDAPGADDIIRNNENGLKAGTGDIENLSESILRLFSDEALAKRLSENALRDAKRYNWDRVTERYLELYRKIRA
jgi:glycosyltransferase involved in cell wall biosynthesis